jgi:hypothetical protein
MLRATIYVTIIENNESRTRRYVETRQVSTVEAFKQSAADRFAGYELAFGPIAPPWSKL